MVATRTLNDRDSRPTIPDQIKTCGAPDSGARFRSGLPFGRATDRLAVIVSVLDRVLEIAARALPAAGVDCLLIGGFAVNHYGYTRSTLDVDLLIASDRLDEVRRIMREAGFINMEVFDNVAFFSVPGQPPRVDFLRVEANTMNRLLTNAQPVTIHGHRLRVPALRDLLAMKIFSLAQQPARRMGKDLPDIAYLSVLHRLDVETEIRPLCDRFGTAETYRLIRAQMAALREP